MNEVILDTNIFLRYLLKDVEEQYRETVILFKQIEEGELIGWMSILVVAEVVWMLEKFFKYKRMEFVPRLMKLLKLKGMKSCEVDKVMLGEILFRFMERKIDFTDVYLVAIAGDREVRSFDKDVKRLMRLKRKT